MLRCMFEYVANLHLDSWAYYLVLSILSLVYSSYDITDKDTLGHLVIH